jgi:hypothetical protein
MTAVMALMGVTFVDGAGASQWPPHPDLYPPRRYDIAALAALIILEVTP